MKIAVIGSRNLMIQDLEKYLPEETNRYGRGAPLKRNLQIIDYADCVLAFWDGQSRGTKFVIEHCKAQGKSVRVFLKK